MLFKITSKRSRISPMTEAWHQVPIEYQNPEDRPNYWAGHSIQDQCLTDQFPKTFMEREIFGAYLGVRYFLKHHPAEPVAVFSPGSTFDSSKYPYGTILRIDEEFLTHAEAGKLQSPPIYLDSSYWAVIGVGDEDDHSVLGFRADPSKKRYPYEIGDDPKVFSDELEVGKVVHNRVGTKETYRSGIRRVSLVEVHRVGPAKSSGLFSAVRDIFSL